MIDIFKLKTQFLISWLLKKKNLLTIHELIQETLHLSRQIHASSKNGFNAQPNSLILQKKFQCSTKFDSYLYTRNFTGAND
jgi:hypothetical protein